MRTLFSVIKKKTVIKKATYCTQYLCRIITLYLDDSISNKELRLPLKSADLTNKETGTNQAKINLTVIVIKVVVSEMIKLYDIRENSPALAPITMHEARLVRSPRRYLTVICLNGRRPHE